MTRLNTCGRPGLTHLSTSVPSRRTSWGRERNLELGVGRAHQLVSKSFREGWRLGKAVQARSRVCRTQAKPVSRGVGDGSGAMKVRPRGLDLTVFAAPPN